VRGLAELCEGAPACPAPTRAIGWAAGLEVPPTAGGRNGEGRWAAWVLRLDRIGRTVPMNPALLGGPAPWCFPRGCGRSPGRERASFTAARGTSRISAWRRWKPGLPAFAIRLPVGTRLPDDRAGSGAKVLLAYADARDTTGRAAGSDVSLIEPFTEVRKRGLGRRAAAEA